MKLFEHDFDGNDVYISSHNVTTQSERITTRVQKEPSWFNDYIT